MVGKYAWSTCRMGMSYMVAIGQKLAIVTRNSRGRNAVNFWTCIVVPR